MKIPFFDYPKIIENHKKQIFDAIESVTTRGAYILQSELEVFEKNVAELTGAKFAVGVGNATDGLEIMWNYLNLPKGGEVIVSAHTMVATATPIIQAGLVPVLCDVDKNGLIDLDQAESLINKNTVAICPTHLNGVVVDIQKLNFLKEQYDLRVVEDAAQVLGALDANLDAPGSCDVGGAISFYPAKVLGCLGDGGAIITNDAGFFDFCMLARNHGLDKFGACQILGRNSRLDNLQAGILNNLLNHFGEMRLRRKEIAEMYIDRFSSQQGIETPTIFVQPGKHAYQNFECKFSYRDELVEYLSKANIGTLRQWRGLMLDDHPAFKNKIKIPRKLPEVEAMKNTSLMLPLNHMLNDLEVEYICDQVCDFYEKIQ